MMKLRWNLWDKFVLVRLLFIVLIAQIVARIISFQEPSNVIFLTSYHLSEPYAQAFFQNISYIVFYAAPVFILLNIPTSVLLHRTVLERVRRRNNAMYLRQTFLLIAGSASIYNFVISGSLYMFLKEIPPEFILSQVIAPTIRVANLLLVYVFVGMYIEKGINLLMTIGIILLNMFLSGPFGITMDAENSKLIVNVGINIGVAILLMSGITIKFRNLEIIKE